METWLKNALFAPVQDLLAWDAILARLLVAFAGGWLVAFVYAWGRRTTLTASTFPGTLVLMTILIAMVTQVIGDNLARAFGLVGALSIVRFRTVMQDTQDVAYVIFAVAVGMSIGAGQPVVALMSFLGVAAAATIFRYFPANVNSTAVAILHVRLGLGRSPEAVLEPVLAEFTTRRELTTVETAKQGAAVDVEYRVLLRPEISAATLVAKINQVEGVQQVQFRKQVRDD
ncbi:hypothetical protein ETAA8_24680 [Anatilimnocola aggregata]|uniref:DUF4956 domain-containing protein n=1 Tax=Anatilimnocola aggregata TaxID=2528021 RepID=A0A517YAZ4_9BACT|nr:DUF4956 domain-containing protein [Anatilimnocola aggregata]QDU27381.1 hypothetical protein ETAA8_24680 [Anatilimnocola aggregata]